jgi:photosystem II stability/assembly factor-like uncharacterized protein
MKKLKYTLVLLLLIIGFGVLDAQNSDTKTTSNINYSDHPYWIDMMKDPSVNFYEVQKAFNEYFKDREKGKGSGWKQFKRWEWFMEQRVYPTGKRLNHPQLWNEMMAFNKKYPQNSNRSNQNWEPLGPSTSVNVTGHWNPGLGRINVIARDPFDENILYIGAPSGGLWKTTNEGADWTVLTDNLPVMGVSAIAIHPTNTDIIYIGTGDKDASDNYSIGVLKSTDGGINWEVSGLDWDIGQNRTIAKLIINPDNPDILFAATTVGIFKTVDAGENWYNVKSGDFDDIEFKPGDPNTIFACTQSFFRSTDGGENFIQTTGVPTSSRAQIAVTEANSDYVYFFSYQSGVYRSSDSGQSFTKQSNEPNQGSQGWYDLAFAVSHVDAEEVHLGEINTWRSTNGGVNWTKTTDWTWDNPLGYTHCDIHEIVFFGGTVYVGSDGLISKSTDNGDTWTNLSEGLCIRQFYRIGGSKTNPYKILGGSQDNGTSVFTTDNWHEWLGADGMEACVDHTNENIVYGTSQNGNFYKSTSGGNFGNVGITQPGGGAWVTPFVMHPVDPEILFVGQSNVRKTTNGMSSWTTISNMGSGNISNMCICESNPDYLYVTKSSTIYRTDDGGNSWDNISSGLPDLSFSYVAVHPSNPEIVAVSMSGFNNDSKVFISFDAGENWENYSANLPNIPANCVIFNNDDNNGLYIGMDVGIYYRDNSLEEWEPFMTDLPNVIVNEMEIHYEAGKIRAATYGRGLWEADLHPVVPQDISLTYVVDAGGDDIISFGETVNLDVTLKNTTDLVIDDVNMTISFDSPYVNITDNSESFGSILPGDSVVVEAAFSFDVDIETPNDYSIKLISNITSSSYSKGGLIKLKSYAPIIQSGEIVIEDGGNGEIDPGETTDVNIVFNNNGGLTANDVVIELSSQDPYSEISNTSASFDFINPNENGQMIINLDVEDSAPIGHIIVIIAEITAADAYVTSDTIGLQVGSIYEDFETGDFSKFPWAFDGSANWKMESTEVYEGDYSTKSGNIGDQSQSIMFLELDVLAAGEISFYKKVSCEDDAGGTGYDRLSFMIDDDIMESWDGEVDWSQNTYPVSKGLHIFKWVYSKDANTVGGQDCAWVDYIGLPPVDKGSPLLFVNPEIISEILKPDQIVVDSFLISNIGGGVLEFEIEAFETDTKNLNDVSWLEVNPLSGNLNGGESLYVEITYNTWDLEDGIYNCNIIINYNEDLQKIVPLELTVDHTVNISEFELDQRHVLAYPNPFNEETTLFYKLNKTQKVSLEIFDVNGKKIATLLKNIRQTKGTHSEIWNGKNDAGSIVPDGIYYYRLNNKKSYSGKVLLKRF